MSIKKNILTTTFCLLAAASVSNAQFGVKLGAGYANMSGSSDFEKVFDGGIIAPIVGVTYHLTLGPIGVKPELLLEEKGASGKYDDEDSTGKAIKVDANLHAWYIDAPILASVSILPTLSIIAGPSIGYYITGGIKDGSMDMNLNTFIDRINAYSDSTESKAAINKLNIGLVAGVQFMLPIAGLGVDARYQYGLTNVIDHLGSGDNTTNMAAVTLTYLF